MRALSVMQPWAWCIVTGRKPVENRSRLTNYRGWFFVHASKGFDVDGWKWLSEQGMIPADMMPTDFRRGGIVGAAYLTDCVKEMDSKWFFGEYGYTLENAGQLPYIPLKGMLGFFKHGLTLDNFVSAIQATISKGQVKFLVEMLDKCWRDDDLKMHGDDWLLLENHVRAASYRFEDEAICNAPNA